MDQWEQKRQEDEQRVRDGKEPSPYASHELKQQHRDQQQPSYSSSGSSGNSNVCFTAETRVLTPTGWKAIHGIRATDRVLSFDVRSGNILPCEVIKSIVHDRPAQIWELEGSGSAHRTRTTEAHSFLTRRGWLKTNQLVVGDVTHHVDLSGRVSLQRLVAIYATDSYERTYNLVTYAQNNFIVETGVAHNFTYCRDLRSFLVNRLHEFRQLGRQGSLLAHS